MKKIAYIQPEITIVKTSTQYHLLAGSNQISGDADNVELNPGNMGGGDGEDAGSRGFEVGVSWAPMKNVVGNVKWFTGKDLQYDTAIPIDGQEKVNTIFTEWSFIF